MLTRGIKRRSYRIALAAQQRLLVSTSDKVLDLLKDPDLDEPVLSKRVGSHLILDPATPLLEPRRAFAASARKTLGVQGEQLVVPRHPTLDRSGASKRKGNLSKVRNVIAVHSGKGGVGKSTVAVNLAATLHLLGARVGIFDADIHGPSLPTMMVSDNGGQWAVKRSDKSVTPVELHGIKCMSYGFVSPGTGGKGERTSDQALLVTRGPQASIMRGPIASKTAEELLTHTSWGELDVLVLDLPPGTGDLHLTMCQQLSVDAAVVVTTPQELAFVDVARGIDMMEALKVPVAAIVENMSSFTCEHGKVYHPFGTRGKQHIARLKTAYGVGLTFGIPLLPALSEAGDEGTPFMLLDKAKTSGESASNRDTAFDTYMSLARAVMSETLRLSEYGRSRRPVVTYDAESNMVAVRVFEKESARQYKIPPIEIRRRLNKVDEMMGVRNVPADTVPKQITPKGNYAVSIAWSDGHSMSIYPFEEIVRISREYDSEKKTKQSS
jgi:Mrp family chromosome partitioning ATPase